MLRAGVSTACLYPRVLEEALYDLALSGVSHVEIFVNTHSELRRSFVDNLAQILHRFDMTCASLHPYTSEFEPTMLFSTYPRRLEDFLEYSRHYFAAMQRLGATVFVLHGNKLPENVVNKEMYFERFRRLSELGASYGVVVAQENVARCTGASLSFLTEMKQALGKQARFVLDIKQAVRSHVNPFDALHRLGDGIVHVHMSDHGEYGDCLLLGKGRFAWDTFLRELSAVSPDCSVILELYRSGFADVTELAANYVLLKNRIAGMQKGDEA